MKKDLFKKAQLALMALCLIFTTTALCSCGGDDDDDPTNIENPNGGEDGDGTKTDNGLTMDKVVGTWKINHIKEEYLQNGKVVGSYEEDFTAEKDYIVVYSDGRAVYMEYSDSRNIWHADGTVRFIIEKGKLTCLGGDFGDVQLVSLDGDDMVVSATSMEGNEGQRNQLTLHRVTNRMEARDVLND